MVVSPGDSAGMADATYWLLEDESRIQKLREGGIASAQRYDYHLVVPELEKYLLQHLEQA